MWSLLSLPAIAAMVISDCRSRTVGIFPLMAFCITMAIASVMDIGLRPGISNLVSNLVVCLMLWSSLHLYFRLTGRQLGDAIGAGDMVFIAAMTPYFTMQDFLVFLVTAAILSLAVWGIPYMIKRGQDSIPLVSGLGICLSVIILYRSITEII